MRFIDTAGMRRRTKEAEGAEYYSMVRALRAIDHAALALLVIDAAEGRDPAGPAAGRTGRRRRQPDRGRPQQVGPPRQ